MTEAKDGASRLGWLREQFLRLFWIVYPRHSLRLQMTPSQVYAVLEQATRPSIERLHLRSTFARGRRYLLHPLSGGSFRMTTTSRRTLSRRRTTATAVLYGDFSTQDGHDSELTLRGRIRIWYLLDVLPLPTFLVSLLVFMPWSPGLIALLILTLYGLSWVIHRTTAALEAHEMIFFVEKVLQDHLYEEPPELHEKSPDVVYERSFTQAWNRFYDEVNE